VQQTLTASINYLSIPCSGGTLGLMKVSLQFDSAEGLSGYSVPVSVMCADVPDAPTDLTLLTKTLDQIVIEWDLPLSDGGTPILGYQVFMK
jgi:hypothetical protein